MEFKIFKILKHKAVYFTRGKPSSTPLHPSPTQKDTSLPEMHLLTLANLTLVYHHN